MWSRAPRWVRWAIGLIAGAFASAFGLAVATLTLFALTFQGCDIDLSFEQPDPNPALTDAVRRCDVDEVTSLIEKGGRPFVDGRFTLFGDGPSLEEAIGCGPKMAEVLLAYAVVNGGGDSVLHAAVGTSDAEVVSMAVEAGVGIDTRDDAGDTALLDAVTAADGTMINLLLTLGADPDVGNDAGQTPLFRAVGLDRPLVVARLLDAGADPNLTARVTTFDLIGAEALRTGADDDPATSPVHDAVNALRAPLGYRSGADADGALEPLTPLYLAVALSSDAVVDALLAAGADATVGSGPAGHLPADAAEVLGRTDVAARIRAAGG